RFADAVASDKTDARAGHDLHRAVVDQEPPGDPDRDIGHCEHAALSPEWPANATRRLVNSLADRASMQVILLVVPAQFIHQMLQTGRERRFWTQTLLQPFADGITNGPAGPVI